RCGWQRYRPTCAPRAPPTRRSSDLLLEIREREEEAAKQAFSTAMQEAARQRAVQAQMEQDLATRKAERKAKVQAHMQEVMAKGAGISALATMNRYENRLKDEEAQLALERSEERRVGKERR